MKLEIRTVYPSLLEGLNYYPLKFYSQYGRHLAILFQILHIQSQYLNVTGPIFLKIGTMIRHYGVHTYVNLFCDTLQYGCQAAILFKFLDILNQYLNMTGQIFLKLYTWTRHCGYL